MRPRAALFFLGAMTLITIKASSARANSLKDRYESNYAATWTAINKLSFTNAQIAFIQGLTTQQMAFIAGLLPAQCTFLANVQQIGVPVNYPLTDDPHTGSTWITNERDFINAAIDLVNDLVNKMQTQHIMS